MQDPAYENPPAPSTLKIFLNAPEKGLGLWIGTASMFFLYLLGVSLNEYAQQHHQDMDKDYTNGGGFKTINPVDLGGNSLVRDDFILYIIVCSLFVLCVVSWVKLVWYSTDPGIIDTRDENFDEVGAAIYIF